MWNKLLNFNYFLFSYNFLSLSPFSFFWYLLSYFPKSKWKLKNLKLGSFGKYTKVYKNVAFVLQNLMQKYIQTSLLINIKKIFESGFKRVVLDLNASFWASYVKTRSFVPTPKSSPALTPEPPATASHKFNRFLHESSEDS